MSALDIPPHPRRTARLALGVLSLIAMAGFTEGMLKQLAATAPPAPLAQAQGPAIAEAQPISPTLQIVEAPRPRPAPVAAEDTPEPADDAQTAIADAVPAAQAQPAPAADAAATAPEPPASAPAAPAQPADPPPTQE
jgi:hypothetical protein